MDELRRERKIRMVLADADIDEYIKLDLTDAKESDPGITAFMKKTIIDKQNFKDTLC